jgi:ribonuclease HI
MLISLFSDASMCHQKQVGGWAAWLKSIRGAMRLGGPFSVKVADTTIAEAMAVVNALSRGLRDGIILPGDIVLVQTDNNAVMGVLLGTSPRRVTKEIRRRRKMSWSELHRDAAERNLEICEIAAAFSRLTTSRSVAIRWRHVKGHMGTVDPRSAVNSYCDKVAREHMRSARRMNVPSMSERAEAKRLDADGVAA